MNALKGALTGVIAAISAREIIQYADAWRGTENQLRQVTSSTTQLADVQQRLVSVAKETRSGFESTANLYARLARATQEMGLAQSDLIDLTTTINQSFAVSGATTTEAAAAITQLSQGLAAGSLRGDEFNSVAEQAPAIMRAIADSLNMTIGELREFAAEGGITAEIVVNALRDASDEIGDRFAGSVATFGQQMEVARTNLLQFVGESQGVNDVITSAGDAVVWLSERLVDLGGILPGMARQWQDWGADVRTTLNIINQMMAESATDWGRMGKDSVDIIVDAFMNFPSNVRAIIQIATVEIASFVDRVSAYGSAIADYLNPSNWFDDDAQEGIAARLEASLQGIQQARLSSIDAIIKERDESVSASEKVIEAKQLEAKAFDLATQSIGSYTSSMKDAIKKQEEAYAKIIKQLDPAQAALMEYFDTLEAIDSLDVGDREKDRLREAAYDQHWKRMAEIAKDGSEEASEEMEVEFNRTAERIASGLQNAIMTGDWDGIGATIGGALAGAISASVADKVAEAMTGQAMAGIFGPLAGAIAGGVAGLAVNALSDFFSGSDWDPTEARQAAQGTGTVLGSIDAKSESIARAVEGSEQGIGQLVGINQGMLQALRGLQAGISGAAALVARERGGIGFSTSDRFSQGQLAAGGLGLVSGGVMAGSFGNLFGPAASVFGALDDALGGLIEDAVGFLDNLTGGLLSSIGSSVFGGDQKVVDEGIRILGGQLSDLVNNTLVQAYVSIKEDGGWFGSDKRFDRFQNLATNQFTLVMQDIYESVVSAADILGMDAASRINQLEIATQRISLEDLSAEEQQAELEAVFSTIFDQVAGAAVPFLEDFQQAGEGLGETLARVANQVAVTEEVVSRLGLQFSELAGAELVAASQYLADATGGLENLISGMQTFVENFATEERQFELAQSDLTRALAQVNQTLPDTRQGFYELLQAQDASTQAGADTVAMLLRLQGVADDYYQYLEDAAESAAAEAKRLADELATSLRGATDEALRDLQRSVSAERAAAQEQYDIRMQANQLATDAARQGLQAIQTELRSIQQATGQLRGQYSPIQAMLRGTALETIRAALSSGDLTGTGEAAQIAATVDESGYATRVAFEREQGKTLNLLSQLEDAGEDQLTTAERSLKALERQADTIQREFDQEQERLDDILANGQSQVDALRGIETAVLSVSQAITALEASIGSEERGTGVTDSSASIGEIESLYRSIGRTDVTDAEIDYWRQSGLSGDALRQMFLEAAASYVGTEYNASAMRAQELLNVPGFANGGTHMGGLRMVGERGPELEMTGPSRIMSHGDLMSALGASREMVNEIKELRTENLAAQRKIEKNTRELKQIQERWNQTGLPETREFV
jgi:tape measure domain-containing protein